VEEEYFVFTMNEADIEAVLWCATLVEAIREKRDRQKQYPTEAEDIHIAKIVSTGGD